MSEDILTSVLRVNECCFIRVNKILNESVKLCHIIFHHPYPVTSNSGQWKGILGITVFNFKKIPEMCIVNIYNCNNW